MTVKGSGIDSVFAIENREAAGDVLLVCEHASNHFPDEFGTLGLSQEQRQAHIAWDPGALGLARGLSQHLDAALVHAGVSRLVYDLNRAPDAPGAMPQQSEAHVIPGNANLTASQRTHRTEAVYLPFHTALHGEIARRIAVGRAPVIVTIHSFTPIYFGKPRAVEFGVIHDQDAGLAQAVVLAAQSMTSLRVALNEPYSAADSVTHTLRLQATPYGLRNVMLEVRNDLLTDAGAVAQMAETIAAVLRAAISPTSHKKVAC